MQRSERDCVPWATHFQNLVTRLLMTPHRLSSKLLPIIYCRDSSHVLMAHAPCPTTYRFAFFFQRNGRSHDALRSRPVRDLSVTTQIAAESLYTNWTVTIHVMLDVTCNITSALWCRRSLTILCIRHNVRLIKLKHRLGAVETGGSVTLSSALRNATAS